MTEKKRWWRKEFTLFAGVCAIVIPLLLCSNNTPSYIRETHNPPVQPGLIAVLGTSSGDSLGVPNPCNVALVTAAVRVYQEGQGPRPRLLLSGGKVVSNGEPMTDMLLRVAKSQGVDPKDALGEYSSVHTPDQIEEIMKIAQQHEISDKQTIIVANDFQTPRIAEISHKLNFNAAFLPVRNACSEGLRGIWNDFREKIATLWFRTGIPYPNEPNDWTVAEPFF